MESIDTTLQTAAQPIEAVAQPVEQQLPRPFFSPTLFSRKPNRDAPDYLDTFYWWAYVEPRAVRFFERDWLITLILCGVFQQIIRSYTSTTYSLYFALSFGKVCLFLLRSIFCSDPCFWQL
jgi:hypothetical protein